MGKIACTHIDYRPEKSASYVFTDFSIELGTDECTVLLGESGTGKTTLGLLLAGAVQPENGKMTFEGQPLHTRTKKIGFLHQNPENQVFGTTVERDIAYGLENEDVPVARMRKKVNWALNLLGLRELRERPVQSLSGGEMQRTALAGLLVMDYDYLVLDEPTSYLDYPSQRTLFEHLGHLQSLGIGLLWITQYPAEERLGDRVIEFGENEILRDTTPALNSEYKYTFSGSENRSRHTTPELGQSIISITDAEYSYPEQSEQKPFYLQIPNYSLREGEYQGWYGYSGTGKSTLAKLIAGIELFDSGTIEMHPSPNEIVYVPQFAERMLYSGTLEQTVQMLRFRPGTSPAKYGKRLDGFLIKMGLEAQNVRERPVWSFSGGEQRRMVLAVALALQPVVLILDEPTIGISPGDRKKIDHVFITHEIPTVVCISHEYDFLRRMTDRAVFFSDGTIVGPQSWDTLEAQFQSNFGNILYKKPIQTVNEVSSS
ncbi:MAG: ATP-binding cassette domain-containing protein [Candidatus Marinimicrobia bacterium]|nr:ATP-binding cassette domain-containing protein [Candidatus Neomarinimicrobiota bacterium]MCF7830156.1 ATP-binding cassette domain-containing protein [Candidatus Neomarinimicrobiota bacterium]MCF7882110.1 ATP-binding cassette domain-containing protein [Candidatus Neomarinimicrobiota bacterium]